MTTVDLYKKKMFSNLSDVFSINEIHSIWINWVVRDILIISLEDYYTSNFSLKKQQVNKINNLINYLSDNKPIQYFFGFTYFMNNKYYVNNSVLIPRPETEELVNIVLGLINKNKQYTILDIGTGSGCIAISIDKLNNTRTFAVDNSNDALSVARKNNFLHQTHVEFQLLDIIEQCNMIFTEKLDFIISNPPYVLNKEVPINSNVLFEPYSAIFVSDSNPLVFYQKILKFSKKNLISGGKIVFEINPLFVNQLVKLITSFDYNNIEIINDFNEKKRFIIVNS